MIIIPNTDLFNACLSPALNQTNADAKQVFFNTRNRFLITNKYLKELEGSVDDPEIFGSLTLELLDNDQIFNPRIPDTDKYSEFVNISINHGLGNCFPVSVDEDFENKIPGLIILNKSSKHNSHWIIRELICRKMFSLKYYDFVNDISVQTFFKCLLDLFSQSGDIYIFNRYIESNHLSTLKGKSIFYFSYQKNPRDIAEFIQNKNELKEKLGGKVKFKVTGKSRIIHERKIFAGEIAVTCDNSFGNLTINDPNWKVDVEHDPRCLSEWKGKISEFRAYA